MASTAKRISAREAREHVESDGALLVCAYDDPAKFDKCHLEGAMPLREFESQVDSLRKDHEIIFYCE